MSYIPTNRKGHSALKASSLDKPGTDTVTGEILETAYVNTSYYGNSYYDVAFRVTGSDGWPLFLRTQVNGGINYGLHNPETRGKVTLHLTKAGRICNITPLSDGIERGRTTA